MDSPSRRDEVRPLLARPDGRHRAGVEPQRVGLDAVGEDDAIVGHVRLDRQRLAGFDHPGGDLDRIVRYYGSHWRRSKALLIGFSQGADVLPAAINRLPANTRAQVQLIALISVGRNADFEFHLTNWLGGSGAGLPIAPEVAKLPAGRVLCIYGRDDGDALCPRLSANESRVLAMPGDHHVNGDYDGLASRIVSAAASAASAAPAP